MLKRLSKRLSVGRNKLEILRFQGISFSHVVELKNGLKNGTVGDDVELCTLRENKGKVTVYDSLKIVKEDDDGKYICEWAHGDGCISVQKDEIIMKKRDDWTTEDFCEQVIVPLTTEKECVYLDVVDSKLVGKEYKGTFVSQARKSKFIDLVEGLENYFKGKDLTKEYIWLDIFSANQPLLQKEQVEYEKVRRELLQTGLHKALRKFEFRVIFMNSWINPYPLSRAWCVWEAYGMVESNQPFNLVLAPGERKQFILTLLDDYDKIAKNFVSIDMRKASCHSKVDLEMIHNAVDMMEGGFVKLNTVVITELRRWLTKTLHEVVNEHLEKGEQVPPQSMGLLLWHCGLLLSDFVFFEQALVYFNKALDHFDKVEKDSMDHAQILNNIATVKKNQGKLDEALKFHEKSLQIKQKQKPDSPTLANTLNNIGGILLNRGDYKGALELLEKAKDIRIRKVGRTSAPVGESLCNIAELYKQQEVYEKALENYEQAVEIFRKRLGETSPAIASVWESMAQVYLEVGEPEKAKILGTKALKLAKEKMGISSPLTASCLATIGRSFAMEDKAKALEYLLQAKEIFKEKLGEDSIPYADTLYHIGVISGDVNLFQTALPTYKLVHGENHKKTKRLQKLI